MLTVQQLLSIRKKLDDKKANANLLTAVGGISAHCERIDTHVTQVIPMSPEQLWVISHGHDEALTVH